MTAHPKIDPETGEMLFFGYSPFPPYLQYHVADAQRRARAQRADRRRLAVDDPRLRDHPRSRDLHPLPASSSASRISREGKRSSRGSPSAARASASCRRGGGNADVRWFDTDACYVFHPMNAYDDGHADRSRRRALRAAALHVARGGARPRLARQERGAPASLADRSRARRRRDPTPLDDGDGEFPRVDERRVGRKHRFGYMAATGPEGNETLHPVFTAIRKVRPRARHDRDARLRPRQRRRRAAVRSAPRRVPTRTTATCSRSSTIRRGTPATS